MQNVSQVYKNSMRNSIGRNRGYIRAYIGIINAKAQKVINANDNRNKFTFFSNLRKPFDGFPIENLYATCEENFSKVDGSMRFMPYAQKNVMYNNGLVTEQIAGTIYISFGEEKALDIKGLTIDFGENYPVNFSIENDSKTYYYSDNNKQNWITEDVFDGTSYFIIKPTKMRYAMNRLRIYQFSTGITNIFSNKEVISYSLKDYVSSISETIPSQDMSLTVDNKNLYYSVDNEESALSFMEIGQEVRASFGYDITGNGDIEWIGENTGYLKTWSANDKEAKFTATDKFDYLTETYYNGTFRENGISLYDLAIDVLADAGITDKRDYYIDPLLKKIMVYNPIPPVKHSDALQIIANAGRCALYQDREKKIHLQASFIPDMIINANNQTQYSNVKNVLIDSKKDSYAICSKDFTNINESLFFMPQNNKYLNTGYISESISNVNGLFLANPQITIDMESGFVPFGISIRFRNIAPIEFKITTYYDRVFVQEKLIKNPELNYINHEKFELMDKIVIEFTKATPYSRVFVDNILIGDVTDFTFGYKDLVTDTPDGIRQNKIKSIKVARTIFQKSKEEPKNIIQEEIKLSPDNLEYIVYFVSPAYDLSVSIEDNPNVACEILSFSNYFAKLRFSGIIQETVVKYVVSGYEYVLEKNFYVVMHNANGEEKTWENPLISTVDHAKDLEEWLSSYFLGDVEYQFKYRGDPSIDANDLFYLELKNRKNTMIRCFENTLNFNGGWSASMKARKVVF